MDKQNYSENEKREFRKFANAHAPKSKIFKDTIIAFIVGGLICTIGQGIFDFYQAIGVVEDTAKIYVSVTLIFLSCLFTGIGLYDKLAKYAGAGTLVPITGFANAVASPAIDAKSEGYILGVASKMFVIAGPVIVFGSITSIIYGVVYFFFLK